SASTGKSDGPPPPAAIAPPPAASQRADRSPAPPPIAAPESPRSVDPNAKAAANTPMTPVPERKSAKASDVPRVEPSAPTSIGDEAPAPAADPASALKSEIAVLDRARAALRAKDSATALAELDRHRLEFPGGALAQEATVLRIEALVARGD